MGENEHIDLDALMARLADGDRSVFRQVFKCLWPTVHRLCLGVLRNPADADDGAQLAMIKIMEHAPDYDRTRPALPWAAAIATWECRSILRKRQRSREIASHDPPELGRGSAPSLQTTPEGHLDHRELIGTVIQALDELSPQDQATLIATFWEESGNDKGAAARKRKQRAVDRLRTAFKRLYSVG